MTKQSEAVIAFNIGMTLKRSRDGTPLWTGWTKEFRTRRKGTDDPVRHERLAAIGKNGTQIRLHKKG